MERTWPNVLTCEAVLNQEYNKWQPPGVKGTPPEHNLDVAFIRMLSGPLDYHQGGMRNVLPEKYRFRDIAPPVQGTRGDQLAMYVVYQNHLPMMADYPGAYRGEPGLAFLVQVPTNLDVGGMTAGEARKLDLPLHFLGEGAFEAELYLDDPAKGPTSVTRRKQTISSTDRLRVSIPRSGGFAARLKRTSH